MRIQLFCWVMAACCTLEAPGLQAQGLAETAFEAGEQARREGRLQGAMRFYDRALEEDPTHRRAIFRRGELHLKLGENEQAMRDFERGMRLVYPPLQILPPDVRAERLNQANSLSKPDSIYLAVEQWLFEAEAELLLNQFEAAHKKVNEAIALKPTDLQVAVLEGRLYARKQQFGAAAEAFNLAILVSDSENLTQSYLARLYASYAYCLARTSSSENKALGILQQHVQPLDYDLFADVNLVVVALTLWNY